MDSSAVARSGAHARESDALAALAHKAEVSTNASGAAIALMDPASGVLICRARSGSHAPDIGSSLQREGTFAGLCVETGQTMCCDDTDTETRLDSQAARVLGIRSMLVTPVTVGGTVIGALAVFSYTRRAFTLAHREVLRALANETAALVAKAGAAQDQDKDKVVLERLPEAEGKTLQVSDAAGTVAKGSASPQPATIPTGLPKRTEVPPRPVPQKRQGMRVGPVLLGALLAATLAVALWFLWRSGRLGANGVSGIAAPAIRLHGSNTLGSEYIPALAKAYLEHIGATTIRVQPTKKEEVLIGGITAKGNALDLDIQSHGSWTGFKDLAAGKADIAMASTRLPDPESLQGDSADTTEKRQALDKLKGLKSAETEFVVGLDGLAIISTAARPAPSLSKQQVCDVFAGKIANWSELDPHYTSGLISVYARDKNSGTRKTFVDMCFEGKDNLPASGPTVFEDSQQLSNSVAKDPNAIGFVGLPFVHPAHSVAVDGRFPDESSVRLEEYAFTRRLYLYRRPHQPGEAELIGEFIEYALSAEGQRVVQQAGFVDQEVRLEAADPPRGAPRDYLALTAAAKRASLELRFEPNSSRLESKALRDIVRLKRVLEDNHAVNDKILVLGFSDAVGNPLRNCAISKERAQAAEAQLHKIGLPNTVVAAFGQQLPLTTESGADALAKNRRVEIWVTPTLPGYAGPTTCR